MNRLKIYKNVIETNPLILEMKKRAREGKDLTLGTGGLFTAFLLRSRGLISPALIYLSCSKYVFEKTNEEMEGPLWHPYGSLDHLSR